MKRHTLINPKMMKAFLKIACLAALLPGLPASAMEVYVEYLIPTCYGAPAGVMLVNIVGGVPPYSILWSTGQTTEVVTGLLPGTYSVTVTDAMGEQAFGLGVLPNSDMSGGLGGGFIWSYGKHCQGQNPVVYLALETQEEETWGFQLHGPGPFTITGPSTVASWEEITPTALWDRPVVRVEMNVPAGSVQTITWTNGLGCLGSTDVLMSTPMANDLITVDAVQGSCSDGQEGQITFTINEYADYCVAVYGPDGTQLHYGTLSDTTNTFSHLAPGEYELVLLPEPVPGLATCNQSVTVTVPDLGVDCGHVEGSVFVDGNGDCAWEAGENRVPNAIIEFTPGPYYASTQQDGGYVANLPAGTYDHAVFHPGVISSCSDPFTVGAGTTLADVQIGTAALDQLDVEIWGASSITRVGFNCSYYINYRNNTADNSGPVTITLTHDPLLTYVWGVPEPTTVAPGVITWENADGLGLFQWGAAHVVMQVPEDPDLVGTPLDYGLEITTGNTDAVPANNVWQGQHVIVASYDPNAKQGRTSSGLSDAAYFRDVDEYIDYTLYFQNTGTDTAFKVVVTDTLPATLDPSTLQIGAASHPFAWSLNGTGVIRFQFDDILLPDSTTDPLGSQGAVSFRIKPAAGIQVGDVIENTAAIYFDFNEPVITNTTTHVVETGTAIRPDQATSRLQVYPNPATEHVLVQLPEGSGRDLRLVSADGRSLEVPVKAVPHGLLLDVRGLKPGIYIIRTATGTRRLIKR